MIADIVNLTLPTIYPITDTTISGLSHRDQVKQLIEGGATLIQLREKRASPRQFFHDAREALNAARSAGIKLIINDRVDIALAIGSAVLNRANPIAENLRKLQNLATLA